MVLYIYSGIYMMEELYVFGYGFFMWKFDFYYIIREYGYICGY